MANSPRKNAAAAAQKSEATSSKIRKILTWQTLTKLTLGEEHLLRTHHWFLL
jgi:hypothetical protein